MSSPFLSFTIPTYNRAPKLARLLDVIVPQAAEFGPDELEIVVADNCSSDNTPEVVARFARLPGFRHFRHDRNLQFDGNVRFLYEAARGQYVWFFGDDDLPLPNMLRKVFNALREHRPEMLVFSFEQPLGSRRRTFPFQQPVVIEFEPRRMIKHVLHYIKMSIYVMRKPEGARADIPLRDTWYDIVMLAFNSLEASPHPKFCILPETLASCDREANVVRHGPETPACVWKVTEHSFIRRHDPTLGATLRRKSELDHISCMYAIKMGFFKVEESCQAAYQRASEEFSTPWRALLSPRIFAEAVLAKLRLGPVYCVLRTVADRARNR